MLVYPDYYLQFQCIAGACRHSCCIGWEIDVDPDTLESYRQRKGDLGQQLQEKIDWRAEDPHFILDEEERCPFLNAQGLCDLILAGGDSLLCQICADHPRFRNFYSDRVEIGLGLCCEAAGRLILEKKEKAKLLHEGETEELEPEEAQFLAWRERLISLAQDRSLTIEERLKRLAKTAEMELPQSSAQWAEAYLQLEFLEHNWPERLLALKKTGENRKLAFDPEPGEIPLEQLVVYFLYRHLAGGMEDGQYRERLAFSILSVMMIRWLAAAEAEKLGSTDMDTWIEIARQYSAEIEYSQENIDALLQILSR